jgi:hypothetical protein
MGRKLVARERHHRYGAIVVRDASTARHARQAPNDYYLTIPTFLHRRRFPGPRELLSAGFADK